MKQPTCRAFSLILRIGGFASVVAALTACSEFDVPHDTQWYAARVTTVVSSTALDSSVSQNCLNADSASERVAVVAVRIHRALHYVAFAIPVSSQVHAQDEVAVNFRLCKLRTARG